MTEVSVLRCAWCNREIRPSGTAEDSHGICLDCLPTVFSVPVESLARLSREQLDVLPYGVVRLDRLDRVVDYNHFESALARRRREDVLGKNFFVDVAPCTNVEQLAGWVRSARAAGVEAETQLLFVFRFAFGQRLVELRLAFESATEQVTIVVREVGVDDESR